MDGASEQVDRKGSELIACAVLGGTRHVLLALAMAGAALPRPGVAQPPSATQADPAYEAARVAFEALPETERKTIQEALVWTGDHSGVTTGGFGRRTLQAIQAYEKRSQLKPDGILDAKERAALQAAAQRVRTAIKFAVATDAKTGARIGIPERMLPKRSTNPNGGARWQSADDKITLDTRAFPAGETELATLYERVVNLQAPGRKVIYKVLRPDFFVVSGETVTGKFYTRYAGSQAGLRGFSIGYDKTLAKDLDKIVIAIANSFEPFPNAVAAAPDAPPTTPPARPANLEPPRPAGPLATGLMVAPRRVLTSAAVESCPELRVGRSEARMLRTDRPAGLALLEIGSDRASPSLTLESEAPPAGEGIVVLAFGRGGGAPSLLVASGETGTGGTISAPIQPGASGAPVFDRRGALIGLVGAMPTTSRVVAGIVPPTSYALIRGGDLARFLEGTGVTLPSAAAGQPRTAGEIASSTRAGVVPIACAR